MVKRMLIDALHAEETRVVIADENQIYDFDFVSTAKKQLKGNIYLAKITRVEPSLQAAFVEYGGGKQGFLPFAEIHTDYYQIPVSDRQRLLEEAAREEAAEIGQDAHDTALEASPEKQVIGGEELITNEPKQENSSENELPLLQESKESAAIEAEFEEAGRERPAYLMQSAIDLSISEEIIPAEISSQTAENTATTEDLTSAQEPSEDMFGDSAAVSSFSENQEKQASPESENPENEEVETLSSDEEEAARNKRKRNIFMRRYKIQEVIRRGQIVLIQVIKEERGNKGVSLTTYLSLAGRYCVLMPNSPKDGGISRKIASAEDRKRLKAISTEFRLAEGMSVIIRTAGMDRTHAEIKRDFDYLVKLWNNIREDTLKATAPAIIYEESNIVKRAIRDQYSNDIEEIIVEGEEACQSAREFMKLLLPSHLPKIKNYSAQTPLFYAYNIEEQLLSMHDPVVKMKSGAYLVINPTEALISIDVNSGRATGERNIEETALKTNLEAAAEVARQLRLRDLAGLVVIDFIDMMESRNRRAVEKMLKDSMKNDRAKIQLGRISPFGLLELSRQRLRPSISETNMTQCPHCVGRGVIRSHESMSIQMIRAIEKEAGNPNVVEVRVSAPQTIALHMLNYKREALQELEKRHNVTIQILIDTDLAASEFNIERVRRGGSSDRSDNSEFRRSKRAERQERENRNKQQTSETANAEEAGSDNSPAGESEAAAQTEGKNPRRNNRRRGRRNPKNSNFDAAPNSAEENTDSSTADDSNVIDFPSAEASEHLTDTGSDKEQKRQPRERGGRGRRKWRDRGERAANSDQPAGEEIPTRWDGGAAALAADASALPAFASDMRPVAEPAPPTYKPFHDYKEEKKEEQKAEKSSSPPKRGWWQKMISLDD